MNKNTSHHITVIIKAQRLKTGSHVMWEEYWPFADWFVGKLFDKKFAALMHEMGKNWRVEVIRVS